MLTPEQVTQYQADSVSRAMTCANCGEKLHVLEIHICEHCCSELMADPNGQMLEDGENAET